MSPVAFPSRKNACCSVRSCLLAVGLRSSRGGLGRFQLPLRLPHPHQRPTIIRHLRAARSTSKNQMWPTRNHRHAAATQPALTGDWLGYRKQLEDTGISADVSLILDGAKTLRGGLNTRGSAWRNLFEAAITVDSKLWGYNGGRVFVDFQNQSGQNASLKFVGDAQKFDNIDADGRTQIAQLWYQQTFFGDALRFKVGKVDANSEFQKLDDTPDAITSAVSYSQNIFVMPTYPDPALGVNVFARPGGGTYVGSASMTGRWNAGCSPAPKVPGGHFTTRATS